jgi:EAL domain-containing protein (putative c-di-GMP-specific phosphodiesterase class I)
MAFQPIVDWREKRVYGYEALLRSDEPLMKNPADMLDAAERLNRMQDLGRAVRAHVAEASKTLADQHVWLFVNLHSSDLNDSLLYSAESPLSKIAPRVVLEITERASLEGVRNVTQQVAALKKLGFQVAVDDLGAGYAGLSSFTLLDPEVVKIDMSLVRGVDTDPRRQAIIKSMQGLCDQLGVLVIAEGVETVGERRTLLELGCNYFQGYLFARPERTFPQPRW